MSAHPLVGRDAELARLTGLISRSHASSRVAVGLVRGDMGTGKSRLLTALAPLASPALVLSVEGSEWEQVVPFAGAASMLRSLSELESDRPPLSALLEEPVRQLEPLQVLEATRRCVAAAGPVLVLADDLQWVDRLSLALLHYLVRDAEAAGLPLTLVAASRPGSVLDGFGLTIRRLLDDPDRTCHVELRPLEPDDAFRLVAALRPDLGHEATAALVRRAGGIPFWLTELAHADDVDQETAGLVAARMAPLSPDARRFAALLAIWASPADIETSARLIGWTTARCSAARRETVDAGLVLEAGGRARLVHDAIGEAVLSTTSPEVLAELHSAVAGYLEADAADDDTVQLRRILLHRRAAGLPGSDTARRLMRSRNRRLLGPDDLAECAQIARAAADPEEATSLLRDVAHLASGIGRPDLALEHWTALMVESGSSLERGRARVRASQCALAGGDPDRARALLGDAAPAGLDLAGRIEWEAHASQVAGSSGAASRVPLQRAARMMRDLVALRGGEQGLLPHERAAQVAALHAEFYFALRTQQVDLMLTTAERIANSADTVEDRLRGALHASFAHRLLGQYQEAEQEARAVRLAAVREPLPAIAFESGFMLAVTQYSLGRLLDARAAAEELAAMAARAPVVVPSWLSAAWVNALGPEIDVSLHGWPAARDRLAHLILAEPHPHFRLHIRLVHAQWAARLAHPSADDETVTGMAAARQDADSAGCDRCRAEVHLRAAEAYARIGHVEAASDALARWESDHDQARGQSRLWLLRSRALIAGSDDLDRAVELMEEVGLLARSMNAGLEIVWADLDLGMLLTHKDPSAAAAVLRRAAESAHGMRAASERQRALQLLRECGVRTWTPGTRSPDSVNQLTDQLTDRERAVVQMIRAGASNPEIAEALFISRKTVERHVSNALAKTNTRNRAELAARAAMEPSAEDHAARGQDGGSLGDAAAGDGDHLQAADGAAMSENR